MFHKLKHSIINLDQVCQIKKYNVSDHTIKIYFSSGEFSIEVFGCAKERDDEYQKLYEACKNYNDKKYQKPPKVLK